MSSRGGNGSGSPGYIFGDFLEMFWVPGQVSKFFAGSSWIWVINSLGHFGYGSRGKVCWDYCDPVFDLRITVKTYHTAKFSSKNCFSCFFLGSCWVWVKATMGHFGYGSQKLEIYWVILDAAHR